jgi:two-component system response regulator HydG
MQGVIARLRQIAPTSATVLITGESGTGKELVARALHVNSPRKNKPFVPLNCAALSETILESELFGHIKGAFTGADRERKGWFEHANGGTLFLDEIGDIPLSTQIKLLRVLETSEIVRVGTNDPIKVNVRLISATNRDLADAIARGDFRQDLYHRLKVVSVKLPALRTRREDIPLLLDHFLRQAATAHGKTITSLTPASRKALTAYDWPGNVRELKNTVESMVVIDSDGVLDLDDLTEDLQEFEPSGGHPAGAATATGAGFVGQSLDQIEKHVILQTLERTGGNREEAARILGIGERTLYRKLKEYTQG